MCQWMNRIMINILNKKNLPTECSLDFCFFLRCLFLTSNHRRKFDRLIMLLGEGSPEPWEVIIQGGVSYMGPLGRSIVTRQPSILTCTQNGFVCIHSSVSESECLGPLCKCVSTFHFKVLGRETLVNGFMAIHVS